jgi:sortase A
MNGIWTLENGDEIIFTSKYGQRVYKVFSKTQIPDTDYSKLGWSNDNIITLITCVKNQPQLRWCIQGILAK